MTHYVEKRRPGRSGFALVPVLAVALVLGVSLFVWSSRREEAPTATATDADRARASAMRRDALPGARVSDDERERFKQTAKQGVVSPQLRESVLPMREFAGGQGLSFRIPVMIGTRERCAPGDFTAMTGDAKRSGKKQVLVSLEPLLPTDDTMAPAAHRVSLDQLKRGQRLDFDVKLKRLPAQLGLFVCRDDQAQGRCATKELVDYQTIWRELDEELPKSQPQAAPDRTYAFQYVTFDSNGRAFTFMDSPIAPQTWDILARRVQGWTDAESAMKALERARDVSKKLDSVPIDERNGQMVFLLPARGEKCPSLADIASGPGGAQLRALLEEVPPERRPKN